MNRLKCLIIILAILFFCSIIFVIFPGNQLGLNGLKSFIIYFVIIGSGIAAAIGLAQSINNQLHRKTSVEDHNYPFSIIPESIAEILNRAYTHLKLKRIFLLIYDRDGKRYYNWAGLPADSESVIHEIEESDPLITFLREYKKSVFRDDLADAYSCYENIRSMLDGFFQEQGIDFLVPVWVKGHLVSLLCGELSETTHKESRAVVEIAALMISSNILSEEGALKISKLKLMEIINQRRISGNFSLETDKSPFVWYDPESGIRSCVYGLEGGRLLGISGFLTEFDVHAGAFVHYMQALSSSEDDGFTLLQNLYSVIVDYNAQFEKPVSEKNPQGLLRADASGDVYILCKSAWSMYLVSGDRIKKIFCRDMDSTGRPWCLCKEKVISGDYIFIMPFEELDSSGENIILEATASGQSPFYICNFMLKSGFGTERAFCVFRYGSLF